MGCGASTAAPAGTSKPASAAPEKSAAYQKPPPNADGSINRKAVLEQLFASVDEDGDGHVTLTEFLAMFDDVDLDKDAAVDDEVKEQFAKIDVDGA